MQCIAFNSVRRKTGDLDSFHRQQPYHYLRQAIQTIIGHTGYPWFLNWPSARHVVCIFVHSFGRIYWLIVLQFGTIIVLIVRTPNDICGRNFNLKFSLKMATVKSKTADEVAGVGSNFLPPTLSLNIAPFFILYLEIEFLTSYHVLH